MAHASSKIQKNDTGGDEDDPEKSPGIHVEDIKLQKLKFGIDKGVTKLYEKKGYFKYITPKFRASASVEIPPLPAGVNIEVGWLQVITDVQNFMAYGLEGLASWEFPELGSGKLNMVNDGYRDVWYGSKSKKHLEGPTKKPKTTTLKMDDHFYPRTNWSIHSEKPNLTFVYRKQRFYTFLALRDLNTNTYQIIRTLTWSMELAIDVNPKKPLGKRAKFLGLFEQESPEMVPPHLAPPLELNALKAPCANDCQACVWIPKSGLPKLLNEPDKTTLSNFDMLLFLASLKEDPLESETEMLLYNPFYYTKTREATSKLLQMARSKFQLQQQQKQQETEEDGGRVGEKNFRKGWWKRMKERAFGG